MIYSFNAPSYVPLQCRAPSSQHETLIWISVFIWILILFSVGSEQNKYKLWILMKIIHKLKTKKEAAKEFEFISFNENFNFWRNLLKILKISLVFSTNIFYQIDNLIQIFLGNRNQSLWMLRRIIVGSFVHHHSISCLITGKVYPNNCIVPTD